MKENYKRFDIVLMNFGQVQFAGEQGGKSPAVILQINLEYFQIFKLEFLKEICIRFYLGNPKFVYYHLKSNVCSAIIKNRKQPICFKRCWRT